MVNGRLIGHPGPHVVAGIAKVAGFPPLTPLFLAPDLVKAAVEGRLPRGIGVEGLRDAPADWSRQFETLGLNPQ
jgi:hypothetical protein